MGTKDHCPMCLKSTTLNKKMSLLVGKDNKALPEEERTYQWECNGQRKNAVHFPYIRRVVTESITRDQFGRITSKIDKETRLILEDSEMHERADEWLQWMAAEKYKYLPKLES